MIVIDGVVGAGKSTLAQKISDKLGIPIYEELKNQTTMNLLEEFYKDKKKMVFYFTNTFFE